MRLDHLLSKEHWPPDIVGVVQSLAVDDRSTAGAQGWNIDYLALTLVSCKYSSFGSVESSRRVAAPGTLLGPEGSGIRPLRDRVTGPDPTCGRTARPTFGYAA